MAERLTQILFPASVGLLYSTEKNYGQIKKQGREKKKENPGLFWWSCIRLRYYSIWCAICDS